MRTQSQSPNLAPRLTSDGKTTPSNSAKKPPDKASYQNIEVIMGVYAKETIRAECIQRFYQRFNQQLKNLHQADERAKQKQLKQKYLQLSQHITETINDFTFFNELWQIIAKQLEAGKTVRDIYDDIKQASITQRLASEKLQTKAARISNPVGTLLDSCALLAFQQPAFLLGQQLATNVLKELDQLKPTTHPGINQIIWALKRPIGDYLSFTLNVAGTVVLLLSYVICYQSIYAHFLIVYGIQQVTPFLTAIFLDGLMHLAPQQEAVLLPLMHGIFSHMPKEGWHIIQKIFNLFRIDEYAIVNKFNFTNNLITWFILSTLNRVPFSSMSVCLFLLTQFFRKAWTGLCERELKGHRAFNRVTQLLQLLLSCFVVYLIKESEFTFINAIKFIFLPGIVRIINSAITQRHTPKIKPIYSHFVDLFGFAHVCTPAAEALIQLGFSAKRPLSDHVEGENTFAIFQEDYTMLGLTP